jgi:hypothetical protein
MQLGRKAMRNITAIAGGTLLIGGAAFLAVPAIRNSSTDARIDAAPAVAASAAAPVPPVARAPLTAEEEKFYRDAAAAAWRYMEVNAKPGTGFVTASPEWHYTTTWDVGGQLLATLSARDIGLITRDDYIARVKKVIATMQRAALYQGAAYNKTYSAIDGTPGDGERGLTGWSATDLGRLLVASKVLATRDPELAPAIDAMVKRIKFKEVVDDEYLHGRLNGNSGKPWTFQEGRIGYEQYSAKGFALWGAKVDKALAVSTNAYPVNVLGVQLLGDKRKLDRLNSEPFILYGLELGMPADVQQLAVAVLKAQQNRYDQTGKITIVSEDAVNVAPEYFYYYCVLANGKPFVIDIAIPGRTMDSPRWVSTKAAFGWHALMPSDYTKKALDLVAKTRMEDGWASGVYEVTGKSTATRDINTAAVILEASAFQLRGGKPLIAP